MNSIIKHNSKVRKQLELINLSTDTHLLTGISSNSHMQGSSLYNGMKLSWKYIFYLTLNKGSGSHPPSTSSVNDDSLTTFEFRENLKEQMKWRKGIVVCW